MNDVKAQRVEKNVRKLSLAKMQSCNSSSRFNRSMVINQTPIQQSCKKAAGTTREEGLPCVRSLRKVSTFNQQISAKSAETRNKEPILSDIFIYFAIESTIFEENLKT